MTDKLLPCPFCGEPEEGRPHTEGDGHIRLHFVRCSCGARGPYEADEAPAIAAWNRRTPTHPPSGVETREQIARIIDPRALWDLIGAADVTLSRASRERQTESLTKADAILAALTPLSLVGDQGSACTNLLGEEPDGSFASDGARQSEGGA